MKFLYWSVGVMQILTGFLLAWSIAPGWRWVWVSLAIYWFFVGCVLAGLAIAKLVTDKVRMGAARPQRAGTAHAPTDSKED